MILTKNITIKTTNKNITHYKSLGFDIKSGDEVTIIPEQLPKGSHEIISVCCDICNLNKNINYKTYYLLTNKLEERYYCVKCKFIKSEKTCLKKYGVKNPSQIEEVKKKNIKKIKNYNKQKETLLEKYGVISYLKLLPNNHDKNHDKMKETIRNKYSVKFFEKSNQIHGDVFNYMSPYKNMTTKIKIMCKLCNHIFHQRPKDHIHNKQSCPLCKLSKGEKEIKRYLDLNDIKYEYQKSFKDCKYIKQLKFDFYLPNYNMCIEYDGEQHYKPFEYFGGDDNFKKIKKRDQIKESYCIQNNIQLLKIKYDENINLKLKKYI